LLSLLQWKRLPRSEFQLQRSRSDGGERPRSQLPKFASLRAIVALCRVQIDGSLQTSWQHTRTEPAVTRPQLAVEVVTLSFRPRAQLQHAALHVQLVLRCDQHVEHKLHIKPASQSTHHQQPTGSAQKAKMQPIDEGKYALYIIAVTLTVQCTHNIHNGTCVSVIVISRQVVLDT
jgi:hypothetical protein